MIAHVDRDDFPVMDQGAWSGAQVLLRHRFLIDQSDQAAQDAIQNPQTRDPSDDEGEGNTNKEKMNSSASSTHSSANQKVRICQRK